MKFLKKENEVIDKLGGEIAYKSEKWVEIEYPNYILTITKIKKGYSIYIREKGSCHDYSSKYIGRDLKVGVQGAIEFWQRCTHAKYFKDIKEVYRDANEKR